MGISNSNIQWNLYIMNTHSFCQQKECGRKFDFSVFQGEGWEGEQFGPFTCFSCMIQYYAPKYNVVFKPGVACAKFLKTKPELGLLLLEAEQ